MTYLHAFKARIKRAFPFLVPIYSQIYWTLVLRPSWRRLGMEGVFTRHYRQKGWGDGESVSGYGSSVAETTRIRALLPRVVATHAIKSILDIPCGDFNWMKLIDLPVEYIGADVVSELITTNQARYGSKSRSFRKLNLVQDGLPAVDLILCRDCLFHFSLADARAALKNIKNSGARFLLATTNPNCERNIDIVTGEWRPLNLEAAPFSLPRPILLERDSEEVLDKHVGLWSIADLPNF